MKSTPKRKRGKTQKMKVKYECIYDQSNQEEKLKADKKLDEIFDFIFRTTVESMKKDKMDIMV